MTDRVCNYCKKQIDGQYKTYGVRGDPEALHYYHPACDEERRARWVREERERERSKAHRKRLDALDRAFFRSCVGAKILGPDFSHLRGWADDGQPRALVREDFSGPLSLPEWTWARFDNLDFRGRVSQKLLQEYESYDPGRDGSFVALGKTGAGKSSLAVAWIWRRYNAARARLENGEEVPIDTWLKFAWVTGYELSGARKRSQLGEESPLVKHAIDVQLLVLDEVGHEPQSEEMMLVIDGRYRAGRPTILTSPLTWEALAQHVGGGAYRRLLEHGIKVDVHAEKQKASVRVVR